MSLSDRMKMAGVGMNDIEVEDATQPLTQKKQRDKREKVPANGPPPPAPSAISSAARQNGASRPKDPLVELQLRAQQALFERLGGRLYDSSMTAGELHEYVRRELGEIVQSESVPLTEAEHTKLVDSITELVLGYGPIHPYLSDASVTEVMVSGESNIFIERNGKLEETGASFSSVEHLRRVIERIVSDVGRRIDESSPMVDARLPDGSRVNAVIPPLAVDGPALTIRKFSAVPLQLDDLIGFQTITPRLAKFFEACIASKRNVLVSGGTGSGKTTLLNFLSGNIGGRERIVTIEDAVELQLVQRHIIRLESRPPNIEGKGAVTIRDLVRNALRMRPDRIIVGEVRGPEAIDMLQAMNTGHEGSLTTLHANTPRDALARLETMVLMAGMDLPHRAIREQIASAIDMIIHISRLPDGTRRIVQVCEVTGMEGDVIQLSDLFKFDYDAGMDDSGRFEGLIQPTGLRPSFDHRLHELGIDLPKDLFGDPRMAFEGSGR